MSDQDKLIVEVGIDHTAVQRGIAAVRRQGEKFWKDLSKKGHEYSKVLKDIGKASTNQVKGFLKGYKDLDRAIKNHNVHINRLYEESKTASKERRSEIKKEIEDLRLSQKLRYSQESKSGLGGKARVAIHKTTREKSNRELGQATGKGIAAALAAGAALLRKDITGAFKEGVKAAAKGWEASFAGLGKLFGKGGKKLWDTGNALRDRGKEKGGIAGASMQGLGAISKMVGGLSRGLGPMLNMVGQLGPLLSLASSSVMAIVKLFIDAEAQAKELNKQILQVAGSSGFWYKNLGRSNIALNEMDSTLSKIRDDATSLSNIPWGINKDDHMAVLTSLSAEGVRVEELTKQFDMLSKSETYASAQAKSFGGTVQVAVAYSRQFGVSLQEISQFQSEMMIELGSNLGEVQKQFHSMTAAAYDSGIAANKFFGIIRGLSSDMTLYNSRREDAVKILGKLGKVMSPRSAQKFMSNLMQGFKNKGRTDLVKMNLLNGGQGGAVVKKDLDRKAAGLADKIGGGVTAADVLGGKSTDDLLKNVAKESQGAIREAIIELRTDSAMNKKGLFGSSMAMGNLSPGAAAQMTENALTRFGSTNKDGSRKKLADVAGEIGPEMMAEQLGISREQLMAQVKFSAALDEQRELLKKGLADESKRGETLEKLRKAGIDESKIDSAGYDDLLDTMDEDTQKSLKDSAEEIDWAKRTGERMSTLTDKMTVFVDFFMNQVYKVLTGIWDAILDMWETMSLSFGGDKDKAQAAKENKRFSEAITGTKNDKLQGIYNDVGGNATKFKETLSSDIGARYRARDKEYSDRQAALAKETNPERKKQMQDDMDRMVSQKQTDLGAMQSVSSRDQVVKALLGSSKNNSLIGDKMSKDKNLSLADAAKDSNFDTTAFMTALAGQMSADQLLQVASKLSPYSDGKSAPETKAAAPTEAKAQPTPTSDSKQAAVAPKPTEAKVAVVEPKPVAPTAPALPATPDILSMRLNGPAPTPSMPSDVKVRPFDADTSKDGSKAKQGPLDKPFGPFQKEAFKPEGEAKPAGSTRQALLTKDVTNKEPLVTEAQGDTIVSALDQVHHDARVKGIKMDPTFVRNTFWLEGKKAVLEATREALFEYFLYSKMDPADVAKGLKDGNFTSANFATKNLEYTKKEGMLPHNLEDLRGFADGGVIPSPKSPDSVFVAARPGETILPKGANASGGGLSSLTIPINVNGPGAHELADQIRALVINTVHEWKRRQKYT